MFIQIQSPFHFSSWRGEIVDSAGQRIAEADFGERGGHAVLRIQRGADCFEMKAATATFHGSASSFGGGGKFLLGGRTVYTFTAKTPYEMEVFTAGSRRSQRVLCTRIDSWKRRFCWAFRQGAGWWAAWQYASWGNLLIGQDYALASLLDISTRRVPGRRPHPLMNAADVAVWQSRPEQEQLLLLALSLRHLCGDFVGKSGWAFSSRLRRSCPEVPSFRPSPQPHLHCSVRASLFRPRYMGEFLAVGNPVAIGLMVMAWVGYALVSGYDMLPVAIAVTLLSLGWVLICRWGHGGEPADW